MAEPSPITRAEALIKADPIQRAAYQLGRGASLLEEGFDVDVDGRAAAYLLLTEVADPAKVYTPADLDALLDRTAAIRVAVESLRICRARREEASLHTIGQAEADVQRAARALAAALGGGR